MITDPSKPVALQTTTAPTNKLAVGTNYAAGLGAAIAGVMAGFGGEALKELWTTFMPTTLQGPAVIALVVGILTTVAAFFANRAAGRAGAYDVVDKPNVPVTVTQAEAAGGVVK